MRNEEVQPKAFAVKTCYNLPWQLAMSWLPRDQHFGDLPFMKDCILAHP
jgi:hypothetical protein